jgi:predicted DNA-binding transcriptional regulator AlpA
VTQKNAHVSPYIASGHTGTATAPQERLWRKSDVAAYVGLAPRTIDNMLASGLPHMKLGARRLRFDPEEVKAWFRHQFRTARMGRCVRPAASRQEAA